MAVRLDDWVLGGSFQGWPTVAHWRDYRATAEDGVATLRAARNPCGEAFYGRGVTAASYRGATVTFRGEVRARDVIDRAGLRLQIFTPDRSHSVQMHSWAIASSQDWTSYELTALVPDHAELIRFSLTLTGPGQVALRRVELTPH